MTFEADARKSLAELARASVIASAALVADVREEKWAEQLTAYDWPVSTPDIPCVIVEPANPFATRDEELATFCKKPKTGKYVVSVIWNKQRTIETGNALGLQIGLDMFNAFEADRAVSVDQVSSPQLGNINGKQEPNAEVSAQQYQGVAIGVSYRFFE